VFCEKPLNESRRQALPAEIDSSLTIRVSSRQSPTKRAGMKHMDEVIIVGAGVGGLTLGLALHAAGIPCRVFESASEIKPIGVGINLLPHATKELAALGLEQPLARAAIATKDATFFNRFGQLIYREPLGRAAGYDHPQFSIHRGDLQMVLLDAFRARAGNDRLLTNHHCRGVEQDESGVTLSFSDGPAGESHISVRGSVAIACDGIHSAIRKQFYPDEGEPRYSGVNMWRGVTRWKPMLSGASMVRAGWLSHGKMVIYPIRSADADGLQLINWVAELETPNYRKRDWSRPGSIDDFIDPFADWHFDWLDVPAFIRAADSVLEFPMVDQDPLPRWSFGLITLLGDAAHPMVPRGSNGAGQAILDARALTSALLEYDNPVAALAAYEKQRLEATTRIVLTNRTNPPDAILREVFQRTGDQPFEAIDDVISRDELVALSEGYKRIAGYSKDALRT
jgi:2-polyprenyl-6-methoxyphenol hydroxylase-like FAD-dependent oxidoreductase